MTEIGNALRERRMALKIDVHEVEETTKIRAKYLRALENEEYNLLPSPAYVKSFLRTYAEYLGLESRDLVDHYKSRIEHREEDIAPFGARPERLYSKGHAGRRWLILAVLVLLVVVTLFVVGTIGGGGGAGA